MKSLVILGLSILTSFVAQAGVISTRVVTLPVNLTPAGIKMSRAGYTVPTVKILIPELAEVTVMDHRNWGEAAPCLATAQTKVVADVVQGRPTIENLPFTIELSKSVSLEDETTDNGDGTVSTTKVCKVWLTETVTGIVRGFEFSHVRFSPLPDRVADDCK